MKLYGLVATAGPLLLLNNYGFIQNIRAVAIIDCDSSAVHPTEAGVEILGAFWFGSRIAGYSLLTSDQDICMILPPAKFRMDGFQLLQKMLTILKERSQLRSYVTAVKDAIACKYTLMLKLCGLRVDVTYWHNDTPKHAAEQTTHKCSRSLKALSLAQKDAIVLFIDWAKNHNVCVFNSKVSERLKAVHWAMVLSLLLVDPRTFTPHGLGPAREKTAQEIFIDIVARLRHMAWARLIFDFDRGTITDAPPDPNATFRLLHNQKNIIARIPATFVDKICETSIAFLDDLSNVDGEGKYWRQRREMWECEASRVDLDKLVSKVWHGPPPVPQTQSSEPPRLGPQLLAATADLLPEPPGPPPKPVPLRMRTRPLPDIVFPSIRQGTNVWPAPTQDQVEYLVNIIPENPRAIIVYLPGTGLENLLDGMADPRASELVNTAVVIEPNLRNLAVGQHRWKARPPRWLPAWINALRLAGEAGHVNGRPLPVSVVGFSRGAFWASQMAGHLGYDHDGVAARFAMVGYYPEPGQTVADQRRAANTVVGRVLCINSVVDTSCPYISCKAYLDVLATGIAQTQGHRVWLNSMSHEALWHTVVQGRIDKRVSKTDVDSHVHLWKFASFAF